MTVAGGIGHALPFLAPNSVMATSVAGAMVLTELLAIARSQSKVMDTPRLPVAAKVMLGAALALVAAILIGNA